MDVESREERWSLTIPFRITGHIYTEVEVVYVAIRDGELEGRGEAAGVSYRNETLAGMREQIEAVRQKIEAGAGRKELGNLMPPGGARNAVDCALWELDAKRAGRAVWELVDSAPPRPLLTTYTLGADQPGQMAARAGQFPQARALKLKLIGDDDDAERVSAVRAARPEVWLGIDANQGLTPGTLDRLMPTLVAAQVELIEQPYPVGRESDLDDLDSPIPIAADESFQVLEDVEGLVCRVDVLNIKLDKCGGLTEALAIAGMARRLDFKVMVGNMLGTSLAMAPAFVVGQLCDIVDLDGPILLASDRMPGVVYERGEIWCPEAVWGGSSSNPSGHCHTAEVLNELAGTAPSLSSVPG